MPGRGRGYQRFRPGRQYAPHECDARRPARAHEATARPRADLNREHSIGFTALTHALVQSRSWGSYFHVREPDPRPLELLLAKGAQYRLLEAALLNDLELARTRLEGGADPNTGTWSYYGPVLMLAAELGYLAMVDLLLDHGADIEATDDVGQRPLFSTPFTDRPRWFGISSTAARSWSAVGWSDRGTALANAAIKDLNQTVELLLARGAKRGIVDALARGELELLGAMLDEKCLASGDVDRETDGRYRLAMLGAARGDFAVLGMLLDRGAAHKVGRYDGHTLLAEAARRGYVEAARMVINRGADLHDVGRAGLTPLAWAMREGRDAMVEKAQSAGGDT